MPERVSTSPAPPLSSSRKDRRQTVAGRPQALISAGSYANLILTILAQLEISDPASSRPPRSRAERGTAIAFRRNLPVDAEASATLGQPASCFVARGFNVLNAC